MLFIQDGAKILSCHLESIRQVDNIIAGDIVIGNHRVAGAPVPGADLQHVRVAELDDIADKFQFVNGLQIVYAEGFAAVFNGNWIADITVSD